MLFLLTSELSLTPLSPCFPPPPYSVYSVSCSPSHPFLDENYTAAVNLILDRFFFSSLAVFQTLLLLCLKKKKGNKNHACEAHNTAKLYKTASSSMLLGEYKIKKKILHRDYLCLLEKLNCLWIRQNTVFVMLLNVTNFLNRNTGNYDQRLSFCLCSC